jgi:hypothetical protein
LLTVICFPGAFGIVTGLSLIFVYDGGIGVGKFFEGVLGRGVMRHTAGVLGRAVGVLGRAVGILACLLVGCRDVGRDGSLFPRPLRSTSAPLYSLSSQLMLLKTILCRAVGPMFLNSGLWIRASVLGSW